MDLLTLLVKINHLKIPNYIFSFFFLVVFSTQSFAQETIFEEKTTVYSSERSFGLGMNSNGFSLLFREARYKGAFVKQYFEIDLGNIKHPREVRSIPPFDDNARGYVFGKLNAFYLLRPSIGVQKVFLPKQSIRGVSVAYLFSFGPSLGFVKPIYLNVETRDDRGFPSLVRERYDPDEHQINEIFGRASFINGFDELQFKPGIFAKFGFQFDYSSDRASLKGIEAGIMADVFFEEIPILAFTENRAAFINLYISFFFGSREVK